MAGQSQEGSENRNFGNNPNKDQEKKTGQKPPEIRDEKSRGTGQTGERGENRESRNETNR